MTEKQAWEFLADLWSRPIDFGRIKVRMGDSLVSGLCPSISVLCHQTEQIDDTVQKRMFEKLTAYALRNGLSTGDYFWPTTLEGAAARVEFCKTQGDLC